MRQRQALANLALLLLAGGVALGLGLYCRSYTSLVLPVFLGYGLLVTLVSWFQMRLEERERLEKLEFDDLAQSTKDASLFRGQAGDTLLARRARAQFEKWFIPGFTLLLALGLGAAVWLFWRKFAKSDAIPPTNPLVVMGLYGVLALPLFLLGRYSATLARLENLRLLRPQAGALLFGCYMLVVGGLALMLVVARFPKANPYIARGLLVLAGLLALELILTLVFELYRPRTRGGAARLLYDSRLAGLIGQPESLFTTAAQALDYQFGFKVSETWFYQFVRRSALWILIGQIAVLLLWTCFVVVEAGEQALLERWGKPVAGRAVLGPGFHFKWPWPMDQVHRFRTEQIQSFIVGVVPNEEGRREKTVLWTVSHNKEEFNLLVASREPLAATNAPSGTKIPPVNLLTVSIPIQYQITNLPAWAYNNADAPALLERLATREVVRYLVSADFIEVMSRGRENTSRELRARIQTAASAAGLGASILFVGSQDIHPPVSVAGAYERVVGARKIREAAMQAALAYRIQTNALAGGEAFAKLREAEAAKQRLEVSALARAASFTNQLPAHDAAPAVYRERALLQAFARGSAGARKYVLASTNTTDVIQINLEDKFSPDLLNITVPTGK